MRYVYELCSNDEILVAGRTVHIDSFISIDAESVIVDGFYIDNGDSYFQEHGLDDVVQMGY